MPRELTTLGDALRAALSRLPSGSELASFPIWTEWADVVGAAIARHARPRRLRRGVLVVEVEGAEWMHELQYLKQDLRVRLNERLGRADDPGDLPRPRGLARTSVRPIRGDASDAPAHGCRDIFAALARELSARDRIVLAPADQTPAAVLVPLLEVEGALHVLFTRRAASLPHHQGQVAFPGGSRDAGDADAEATALREAHEEIGLRPADVRVLGRLDDIETVASRFLITPVVGVVPHPYPWRPCAREVDTIFTVPLHDLLAPGIERRRALGLRRPAAPDPLLPGRRPGDLGRHASHHAQSARRVRPGLRAASHVEMSVFGSDACTAASGSASSSRSSSAPCSSSRWRPRVSVDGLGDAIGRGTPLRVTARDRGSGLAHVEVRLVPGGGGEPLVLARQDFPRTRWFGSGVYETTLAPTLGRERAGARGHGDARGVRQRPLAALGGAPGASLCAAAWSVDVTPPRSRWSASRTWPVSAAASSGDPKVGADAVSSGVQVGDLFFPASSGVFKDADLRPVIFALPENSPGARPVVVATDAAGNRAEATLDVQVQPRKFAEKTLADHRRVPRSARCPSCSRERAADRRQPRRRLPAHQPRAARSRPRRASATCLRHAAPRRRSGRRASCACPAPPLSGFADRRTYTHDGKVIDHQTHLGYDIASLKNARAGRERRAASSSSARSASTATPSSSTTGWVLFSLYGHLSEVSVTRGRRGRRAATSSARPARPASPAATTCTSA